MQELLVSTLATSDALAKLLIEKGLITEGVIAHEITHLRWRRLRHGFEFNARVAALLCGAQFSAKGRWSSATRLVVAQTRVESASWIKNTLRKNTQPPAIIHD